MPTDVSPKPIRKLLVANRGEIARRVMRTCRAMGISTVAVFSDPDRGEPFVAEADEAVALGGATPAESYLRADAIVAAARATGVDAIHPGYGFLSEDARFARLCEESRITFVGPPAGAIAAMGSKLEAKRVARRCDVPQLATREVHDATAATLDAAVRELGLPLLVKASAGGGGRGMRIVRSRAELDDALASARREAGSAFGDDTVFLEPYVESPRHVEIQIFADAHGNAVHLFERECSIQRRYQKIVEEAPSPALDDALRARMGEAAVRLAREIGYRGAGTVEFLLAPDGRFFFLEVNTRLQVEHPVTECITGLDLVEQMIRVAAGEKLAFAQADVRRNGWAIECRINAEDPFRGFLPSTGRLVRYLPPPQTMESAAPVPEGGGVRVDTGVYEGGEIPMYYDSMIAKLIVHGFDRADAIARMREALNGFVIRGVSSNIPFQAALLVHPKFISGDFNTGFIAEHYAQGFRAEDVPHEDPDFLVALAAAAYRRYRDRAASISGQLAGHGVRIGNDFVVVVKGEGGAHRHVPVYVAVAGNSVTVTVDGRPYTITMEWSFSSVRAVGSCNGRPFTAQLERQGLWYQVVHDGRRIDAMLMSARASELLRVMPFKAPPDLSRFLLSPMPGLLVDIAVQPGQAVRAGERLAVIEAMKMENILTAAQDGTVGELLAAKGESLSVDQPIMSFA